MAVVPSTDAESTDAEDVSAAGVHEGGSLTRRGVLAGAAAVAGIATLGPLSRAAAPHPALPRLAITDPRFAESSVFVAGIGSGVRHVQAGLDICRQWYDFLQPLTQQCRGAVTGLTTWIDFLVLRGCLGEAGLVCRYRGEHAPRTGDGMLVHTIFGDDALIAALIDAAHDWPRALGAALAAGRGPAGTAVASAVAAVRPPGHMRMVSWLFSPR